MLKIINFEKWNQYEWRGIPEYWMVNPVQIQVTVLFLTAVGYQETIFVENEQVHSPSFADCEDDGR